MAKQIIKGNELMLFDAAGKSLAYATSHTLTITGETADTSTKDHGIYGSSEVTKITWQITSENLYTVDEFDALFTKMIAREAIDVYFATKNENDPDKTVVDGDYTNWTGKAGFSGKAIITSLVANAAVNENATFSLTLEGAGKITKVSTIPA